MTVITDPRRGMSVYGAKAKELATWSAMPDWGIFTVIHNHMTRVMAPTSSPCQAFRGVQGCNTSHETFD